MIVKKNEVRDFDFSGLSITDFTAGKSGNGSFALIKAKPGSNHKTAWSKKSDKFYYIISGCLNFCLNGDVSSLSAGDFCLVPKETKFSYKNDGNEECILALFHSPSFDLEQEVFEE